MLYTLNNIAYLLAVAGIGFALLYGFFTADRRLIFCLACAFSLPVSIAFLAPNVLIANVLIGLVMISFWRERAHFGAIYVFGLITLPLVSQPVTIASIYLFDFSFVDAWTVAALIGFLAGGHSRQSRSSAADALVGIIIIVIYLATIRETSSTNALREFFNFILSYVLPYYIISRSVHGALQTRSVMLALAGSAVVLSTLSVYEATHTWPIYRGIWAHYGIELDKAANVKMRGGVMRSAGPYSEPLSFAFAMTIGLVALLSIRQELQKRWHYALLCAVVVAGLIAPQGRGAWIGALGALFVLDLYRRNYRRLTIKAVLIGIAGVIALAVAATNNRVAVMLGLTAEGQGTLDYREQLLTRGIEEFWKNPLFGDAIGDVLSNMRDLIQGEGIVDLVNGYLHIALISGAVGLFMIILSLVGVASLFLRARKADRTPRILRDTTAFAFASLIAIAFMMTGMSIFGRPLIILFIVIACGVGASRIALLSDRRGRGTEQNMIDSSDKGFDEHIGTSRTHAQIKANV